MGSAVNGIVPGTPARDITRESHPAGHRPAGARAIGSLAWHGSCIYQSVYKLVHYFDAVRLIAADPCRLAARLPRRRVSGHAAPALRRRSGQTRCGLDPACQCVPAQRTARRAARARNGARQPRRGTPRHAPVWCALRGQGQHRCTRLVHHGRLPGGLARGRGRRACGGAPAPRLARCASARPTWTSSPPALVGTRSPYGRPASTPFDATRMSAAAPARARPSRCRAVEVPFALGTDTAGSGRVPAGLVQRGGR